jgi:hypothetical protein
MKSTGGWNWSAYLEWILVDRKEGDWSWFSLIKLNEDKVF